MIFTLASYFLFAVFLFPQQQPAQIVSHNTPQDLVVNVPVRDWLLGYLDWTSSHSGKSQETSSDSSAPLMLPTPYLDVFSPDGSLVYHGTIDSENAAFLHDLTKQQHPRTISDASHPVAPALSEWIDMIPKLKPYKTQLLDGAHFTVFAVTNGDLVKCKLQDGAIKAFGTQPNIQVIDIRLIFS